jgi:sulfide:quinone oxidoreductase
MRNVTIIGGGFAAIAAVEEFLKHPGEVEITLIGQSREFFFYPALVPYLFDELERGDISFDLRKALVDRGVRFIEGEVLSVDPSLNSITITGDDVKGKVRYGRLLIAIGRRLATEHVPGFFEYAHHLLSLPAADRLKEEIANFNGGTIVVGLTPGSLLPIPVCETALGLARRFREHVQNDAVQIKAVFPETLEDAFEGSSLFRDIRGSFDREGVELIERFPVDRVEPGMLVSETSGAHAFDLLVLLPPFRGQSPVMNLDAVSGNAGFIHVNEMMQVAGNERIYAAGDIVSAHGPRFGYMAIRQGRTAARNILAEVRGEAPGEKYDHKLAWIVSEKYSDPVFFHYGFWDESLEDYDEDSFFGKAKLLREKYGRLNDSTQPDKDD